jgi:hypothetical protein
MFSKAELAGKYWCDATTYKHGHAKIFSYDAQSDKAPPEVMLSGLLM